MNKYDIQKEVTDRIIELLEKVDLKDYEPPFASLTHLGLPFNPTTSKHYKGVNILALWFNQEERQLPSNEWATFKQWKEIGAIVKKGEKASKVIFYKTLTRTQKENEGSSEEIKIPMLRVYSVFNAAQVNGYENGTIQKKPEKNLVSKSAFIDQFCKATKADIRNEDNNTAFYHRVDDYINLPHSSYFLNTMHGDASSNYYSTLLHELTHWTGAKHRLDREKSNSKSEKEKVAFEELVAELGASFMCAQFDLNQTKTEGHALYIKSWLQALRGDKSYVFKAAAKAGQAVEYLNKMQNGISNE